MPKADLMQILLDILDVIRHMDDHLADISAQFGGWIYLLLWGIIFAETGLVIMPFLPGDSLLFAVGALIANPDSALSLPLMSVLLLVAAILGDAVNYAIGRYIGPRVFSSEKSMLLNREHLDRARKFYERHGGKAVFLARFAPILRTFAPFVAGVGRMDLARFWMFNITGAVCWVMSFLLAGYFVGHLPFVKENFTYVIFGIIIVSLLPIAWEWYRATREDAAAESLPAGTDTAE